MSQSQDPLHGITLENLLVELEAHFGWEELGERINIRCFTHDASVKSSLKFLRKTPWARTKVEQLFIKYKQGRIQQPKAFAQAKARGGAKAKPVTRAPKTGSSSQSTGKSTVTPDASIDPWAKYR
jgi:uncharacterized protein (DUF2132 family)